MSDRMSGGMGVIGAMVVPSGPDDKISDAHNKYVRAVGFGKPVDGKTAKEWLGEENRLRAEAGLPSIGPDVPR